MKFLPAGLAMFVSTVLAAQQPELAIEMEIATKDLHLRRDGTKLVAEFELVVAEKSTSQASTPRRDTQKIRLLVRDRFTGCYGSLDIDLRTIP